MDLNEFRKIVIKLAKEIIAKPQSYDLDGAKFIIHREDKCKHNEPHVHVKEDGEEVSFSLRNGEPLTDGNLKHQQRILKFLKDKSNRRRLLRRYKKYQTQDCCVLLTNPNLDF